MLLTTLFFTLVVTLTTLSAFELLRDDSVFEKHTLEVDRAKAHLWHDLPALEAISNEVPLSCDVPWQSPATTQHELLTWWQDHGCPVGAEPNEFFIREQPILSESAMLVTDTGWVKAKLSRVTVVRFTPSGEHPTYQSWLASPSQEKVSTTVGVHPIKAGRQQLECLMA